MMVIDTSAVVAILNDEPERRVFNLMVQEAKATTISAVNLLEARIVLFSRFGHHATLKLDSFISRSEIIISEITEKLGDLAFQAYRVYGKGTGNSASLNFGDCFSYALAKSLNAPLLFKGEDFGHTDVLVAYEGLH